MIPKRRAGRMAEHLPRVLQGGDNVRRLLLALATEMGAMESGVTRLLRSRWYALAEGWPADAELADARHSDLGRYGAAFGLAPTRGETSEAYRRHLREYVAIHRDGLTTAPAILRLIALAYLSETPPSIHWEGSAEDGWTAVANFTTRTTGGPVQTRVELVDNPRVTSSASFSSVVRGRGVQLTNRSMVAATPEIIITAREALHVPSLEHAESGLLITFAGSVAAGQTITLRRGRAPLVDGRPAQVPVFVTDPFYFDEDGAVFGAGLDDPDAARFSKFSLGELPELPRGVNHWRFTLTDKDALAGFVAARPDAAELVAHALAEEELPDVALPLADLELRWTEWTPASFRVRVPASVVPWHVHRDEDDGTADLDRLFALLRRAIDSGRAAGVRAELEAYIPELRDEFTLADRVGSVALASRERDAISVGERPPARDYAVHLGDALTPGDRPPLVAGEFDLHAFDHTLFG